MAVSGHTSGEKQSSGESSSAIFASKTPILGLRLYVIIAVTVVITIAVFVLIFLFLRSKLRKRRRMSLRQSSGLLPLVFKDIHNSDRAEISKADDCATVSRTEKESKPILNKDVKKYIEIESDSRKKGSSESNGSSTSRSESSSAVTASTTSTSAEGMNMGWGRWYSFKELEIATDGFVEENVIGEGGYGIVYRGVLQDGSEVAVKNLLNKK